MPHLIVRTSQPNPEPDDPGAKAKPGKRPGPQKLEKLRQQRDELYEEARDNPESEAGEIVRSLLLSGILSAQEDPEDEAVRRSWDEDRQEQELVRGRAIEQTGASLHHDRSGALKADSRIREVQSKMAEVARVAAEAATRPTMDATAVYSRIAEIIGLQPPAAPAQQQRNEDEPGELNE